MTKSSITLKTIIAATVAAMAFTMVPQSAEAGYPSRKYSHKCGGCGKSIYAYPSFAGYNSCGDRVYRYVPRSCGCSKRSSYRSRNYYRGSSKADAVSSIIRGIIELKHGSHHRHRGW